MNGYEALAFYLKAAGVNFCVLAQNEGLEPLARALSEKGIDFLVPISETASAVIADGYARASGKPAILIGRVEILKLITGTVSAWADKTPLLLISIEPANDMEEIDLAQVFKNVTRFQARANAAEDVPEILIKAFRAAVSLRGGPVFIEIPESVLKEEVKTSKEQFNRIGQRLKNAPMPVRTMCELDRIPRALAMLSQSQKPLIFSGAGVISSDACIELNQLAQLMQIPIISSLGGMGSVFPDNPMHVGPPSYLAGEAFHTAIKETDVVLAVGCVFSGLDGFGIPPLWSGKIKFIQVNIDPEHIAFNPSAELPMVGDAKLIISQMLEQARNYPIPTQRTSWLDKLKRLSQEHRQRVIDESSRPWKRIHPASVALELTRLFMGEKDVRVVLDGGNTCLWAGMLTDIPGPRRGFFPTGMGTLGSGVPMAIGVKKAIGDARVVLICGDGTFLYNIQEFETLRRHKIPLLVVVFNDSAWNMIRAGQVSSTGEVFGTDLPDTDYGRVAESFGCFGTKVRKKEEIEGAVKKALASGLPAVIDIEIDTDTIPDSLISFGRVEFEGAKMSTKGTLRSILTGKQKLDIRLWNQIKYIFRSF